MAAKSGKKNRKEWRSPIEIIEITKQTNLHIIGILKVNRVGEKACKTCLWKYRWKLPKMWAKTTSIYRKLRYCQSISVKE
jgi:hypothetical protein